MKRQLGSNTIKEHTECIMQITSPFSLPSPTLTLFTFSGTSNQSCRDLDDSIPKLNSFTYVTLQTSWHRTHASIMNASYTRKRGSGLPQRTQQAIGSASQQAKVNHKNASANRFYGKTRKKNNTKIEILALLP